MLTLLALVAGLQSSADIRLVPQIGHAANISELEFSPDGETLYSSGGDNKIVAWNVRSRRQNGEFTGFLSPVGGFSASADGTQIAGGETWISNRAFLISLANPANRLQLADVAVKSSWNTTGEVRFSPSGKLLARELGHEVISLYDATGRRTDNEPPMASA